MQASLCLSNTWYGDPWNWKMIIVSMITSEWWFHLPVAILKDLNLAKKLHNVKWTCSSFITTLVSYPAFLFLLHVVPPWVYRDVAEEKPNGLFYWSNQHFYSIALTKVKLPLVFVFQSNFSRGKVFFSRCRVVKSIRLRAKITAYLVSIGQLLCLAFHYGWHF